MILDYSQYLNSMATVDLTLNIIHNKDPIFFKRREWCPFCQDNCKLVDSFNDQGRDSAWPYEYRIDAKVWQCEKCSWWELKESERFLESGENSFRQRLTHGILRKYDPSSMDLPIKVLSDEINKRCEVLYSIHYKKMEELVASVLGDFFECDVTIVGASGDGGIDLVMIDKDAPVLVQVKRRTKPEAVESVAVVREFLGALLLKDSKRGIFVTTAKKFSGAAKDAASHALSHRMVQKFDLIDIHRFLEMAGVVHRRSPEPWAGLSDWILPKQAIQRE